jgi:two-component system cell cycle response regulator
VARIGGEEFVVLMPETDLEQAAAVARRLVVSVSEDIPSVVGLAKKGEKVTLSLGVACLKASRTLGKASKLLKRADQSLYQAKKAGRNRVGPPLSC